MPLTGHDDPCRPIADVARDDRARLIREDDFAVTRDAEWRGDGRTLRTCDEHDAHGKGQQEQGEHDRHAHRDARRGRDPLGERSHGKPPFGEGPAGSLPRAADLAEDVVEVVGRPRRRDPFEDLRQTAFDGSSRTHANCPPGTASGVASAVSSVTRIVRSARWSRDLTVPTGIRIETATSCSGIPRK